MIGVTYPVFPPKPGPSGCPPLPGMPSALSVSGSRRNNRHTEQAAPSNGFRDREMSSRGSRASPIAPCFFRHIEGGIRMAEQLGNGLSALLRRAYNADNVNR